MRRSRTAIIPGHLKMFWWFVCRVSCSPWDVASWLHNKKKCLLVTHKQVLGLLLESSKRSTFLWSGKWRSKASDESDVLGTGTQKTLCGKISQISLAPETFFCSHSLWAAGEQAVNSWAVGVMESRGVWPGPAPEGSALFTSEQCLLY